MILLFEGHPDMSRQSTRFGQYTPRVLRRRSHVCAQRQKNVALAAVVSAYLSAENSTPEPSLTHSARGGDPAPHAPHVPLARFISLRSHYTATQTPTLHREANACQHPRLAFQRGSSQGASPVLGLRLGFIQVRRSRTCDISAILDPYVLGAPVSHQPPMRGRQRQ